MEKENTSQKADQGLPGRCQLKCKCAGNGMYYLLLCCSILFVLLLLTVDVVFLLIICVSRDTIGRET